ncbi:MAG: cobalamin biosynthesis protein CobG [Pseudomonadota bacterium]
MMSGDGLILRLRPDHGRIEAAGFRTLCALARRHGNGVMEVTSRASLQLRGVSEAGYPDLLAEITAAGLMPRLPQNGAGIVVQPFWRDGQGTGALEAEIAEALGALPPLPAKFGIALDHGAAPCLSETPADIRMERCAEERLIVRADGAPLGRPVTPATAAEAVAALATWFLETGGAGLRRMHRHLATQALPQGWATVAPASPTATPNPGPSPLGPLVGLPFGQAEAVALEMLIDQAEPVAIRMTPWRALLLEGAMAPVSAEGFIHRAGDPLRLIEACPGAPACASATVDTRSLARALAERMPNERLHVSGCAKGCAWPRRAKTVIVGREGWFDLVRDGHAWDEPTLQGLTPAEIGDALVGKE